MYFSVRNMGNRMEMDMVGFGQKLDLVYILDNSNSKITNNNYYEKVVNEFVEY